MEEAGFCTIRARQQARPPHFILDPRNVETYGSILVAGSPTENGLLPSSSRMTPSSPARSSLASDKSPCYQSVPNNTPNCQSDHAPRCSDLSVGLPSFVGLYLRSLTSQEPSCLPFPQVSSPFFAVLALPGTPLPLVLTRPVLTHPPGMRSR